MLTSRELNLLYLMDRELSTLNGRATRSYRDATAQLVSAWSQKGSTSARGSLSTTDFFIFFSWLAYLHSSKYAGVLLIKTEILCLRNDKRVLLAMVETPRQ